MDPIGIGILGAILILMLLIRIPIAGVLVAIGTVGLFLAIGSSGPEFNAGRAWSVTSSQLGRVTYSFVASFSLMAIPMFLLMGALASASGLTRDAYAAARLWLARWPGGLVLATVVGCGFFAAITGSSLATASAMGRIAVPEMLAAKYDRGLATGAVAAGGGLGALIPPSVLMVLYAIFTQTSIAQMLVAGLVPGLLTAGAYMVMIWIRAKISPELTPEIPDLKPDWGARLRSAGSLVPFGVIFLVMMVGIYGGFATASEAAAFGAFATLLLGLLRRRLSRKATAGAFDTAARETAAVFAIAIGAAIFSNFVAYTGVPADVARWIATLNLGPIGVMVPICLIYIALGMFLDPISTMLVTLAVIIPIVEGMDMNLIWFGVVVVKLLEIGMVTPPVGLNVFVLQAAVRDVDTTTIFKGVSWFIAVDILVLILLIAFPQITLWLPQSMGG
ncbi:MAG: TRAP transporter large permease [Roseovarius sp.]